ncbi:MAG: hypothetical protein RLZZ227_237 [Pseudomonadota bacterium]|jgi:hypothetical protein
MNRFPKLPVMAATGMLLLHSGAAFASKPEWTPIAELLVGSLGTSNPAQMSDVMSRCTALNMILSGMASDFSPEMAEHYRDEAHQFIQNNVLIESELARQTSNAQVDIPALSDAAIEEVRAMVDGYNEWLDDNIADSGSYFSKDIDMEIESCKLASRLATSLSAQEAE